MGLLAAAVGDVILKHSYLALAGAALLLMVAAPASAGVINGGFEDSAINTLSGSSGNIGTNFATGWGGYTNTPALLTISDASPSTDPFAPGGAHMAHIVAGGSEAGLYQMAGFQFLSADFFVVSGVAQLTGLAPGFIPLGTVTTTQTNAWQHLTINFAGNANELVLYSSGGGAEFYVDNVVSGAYNADLPPSSVTTHTSVPEPASWALMLGGFGLMGAALRRRQTYRLVELAADGATSSETFRADDDQSALAQALGVAQGVAVEIWRDDHMVTRVDLAGLAAA